MEGRPDLDRERFAVAALQALELKAPLRLRERIEAERERARGPARRRRLTLGGGLAERRRSGRARRPPAHPACARAR
jgi:hypothetical protein